MSTFAAAALPGGRPRHHTPTPPGPHQEHPANRMAEPNMAVLLLHQGVTRTHQDRRGYSALQSRIPALVATRTPTRTGRRPVASGFGRPPHALTVRKPPFVCT